MIGGWKIPFFLAARFLKHGSKWTFSLIVLLMAIAFVNLIFVTALFNGIIESVNNQVIDTHMGHIYIFPPEGSEYIENMDDVSARIKSHGKVRGVSPHLYVPGKLLYKNISGTWQIVAIDPEQEKTVTNVSKKMIEGSYLEKDDTDRIIIGRQIAGGRDVEMNALSFRGARAGESVTLDVGGFRKTFTIKGVFYTRFLDTDKRAFISRKLLDEMVPGMSGVASSMIIRIDKTGDEKKVIHELGEMKIRGKLFAWKEAAGYLDSVTESFIHINTLLTMVGMMIAAITIFIVIYVDLSSRRQQIGVLRAIGIRPSLIHITYILQTLVYSLAGILIGLLVLLQGIVPWMKKHPFEMPIGDAMLVVNYHDLLFRAALVVIVALLSGLIPVFITTKTKILDAIFNR
ncbi:MAG TPA: ABC transporter permease [Spirochaetota bacterium]|nr:ABC transporter permease [Spirochaetota bacterium]HPC42864.1 ABC transporter permease [Spirochaetota bacterium]HPL16789.1 ABC transporter permease [Spirochaetota bacterium]HQF07136.1 ABC transporter permease [Spirochaetota bacterium]HQH95873.1 ABC transporter permease [Spirochaetota bacterium]